MSLNEAEVMGQAVAFVTAVARVMKVRPPHVSRAIEQPASNICGLYHEASRTIRVIELEDPEQLANTLLHEFQHYLDDLYGRELGGALRGTHDASFYRRLDRLKLIVAEALATT